MIYSHIRMFMLGEEVGGAWPGGRRALFPFDQIFQNTLYVQNILYGGIRYLRDIFAKSFKISLFYEGADLGGR